MTFWNSPDVTADSGEHTGLPAHVYCTSHTQLQVRITLLDFNMEQIIRVKLGPLQVICHFEIVSTLYVRLLMQPYNNNNYSNRAAFMSNFYNWSEPEWTPHWIMITAPCMEYRYLTKYMYHICRTWFPRSMYNLKCSVYSSILMCSRAWFTTALAQTARTTEATHCMLSNRIRLCTQKT